jgi:endo-1,4-beta-xylanase
MIRHSLAWLAFCLILIPVQAAQAEGDNILDKLVNVPSPKSWVAQGMSQWPEAIDDPAVQGGQAMRFEIRDKGANPWSISANVSIVKPVKAGDVVLFAFWARAELPLAGQSTASIPGIRIQETKAPYGTFAQDAAAVTGKWAMYYASGVADKDYKPGTLIATLQLAAGKQTIDLGPVFVLDFGPDYDKSKLPHNAGVAAAPPPPPSSALRDAEQRFSGELAKIRALLPVPGTLINDPAVSGVGVYGPDIGKEVLAAAEVAGGQAVRVRVEKKQPDSFASGTVLPLAGDIRKGDTVFIAFYARAMEVSNEAQSGVISAMRAQMNHAPWAAAAEAAIQVPQNKWQLFYISGISEADIPAGSGMLSAQIGGQKQVIDFGPAFVLNLGAGIAPARLPANKVSYRGREAGAPWRVAAEARIRQLRMGELAVAVQDAKGQPVPGALVHVAMQRHLFHFGGFAGFDLASAKGRDADKAREAFLATFNISTSPIYWSDWGWQMPQNRDNFLANIAWLKDRGVAFRGHPVVWPREDLTPSYIRKLKGDPAAARRAVLEHVRLIVPKTAGACCLDAVNEPRDGVYLPAIAGADILHEVFRTAHRLAPDTRLFVNEYGIIAGGGGNQKYIDLYKDWIRTALADGVPLGGIGIQGHFGAELTEPSRVLAILDDFSQFKLPIEITEFDADTQDEDAQADYTRDLLTLAFSHPSVDAIIAWGWRDFQHPTLAMYRPDWSEKPNHKVWIRLTRHDWWTDTSATTDAAGKTSTHAFFGDYKISVSANGKTVERSASFAPGAAPVAITLN